MTYHLISAAFLIAAGVLYIAGFSSGVVAVLAAAVTLEIAFWIRVVRGRRVASMGVMR